MKTTIKLITITSLSFLLASCGGMQIQVGPVATIGWNGFGDGGGRQQMTPPNAQTAHQQQTGPRYTPGQFVSNDCFGNQPVRPTRGCVRIKWEDAFGPQGPWINDFGRGRAQVQSIPVGQMILFDQQNKWAWKEACGNRVMMAIPPLPQPQARPVVQQQWGRQQAIVCEPPIMRQPCPPPMIQPCLPRQPRLVYIPYQQQRCR